ncbi:unnamed protein product [Darwinula stevensoni]|uniref:Uncharacterized protein n=1 Tax=Darwinula stevensoni TaxID=69355 RepID=A0A7R8ZXS6_9CRUS|nr:unnamed protein product [Darwinula stevensoni]CAG0880007.1 unnamed protein product [Darwinula stevensoni]
MIAQYGAISMSPMAIPLLPSSGEKQRQLREESMKTPVRKKDKSQDALPISSLYRTWTTKRIFPAWHSKKMSLCLFLIVVATLTQVEGLRRVKRGQYDQSISTYVNDRTCYWNEPCKEEFQNAFRCRCPGWSYCRGPGKYYNAHCAMSGTGYIWMQEPPPIRAPWVRRKPWNKAQSRHPGPRTYRSVDDHSF